MVIKRDVSQNDSDKTRINGGNLEVVVCYTVYNLYVCICFVLLL